MGQDRHATEGARVGPNGAALARTRRQPLQWPVLRLEPAKEERAFMRAIVAGLAGLDAGRQLPLAESKARLGLR